VSPLACGAQQSVVLARYTYWHDQETFTQLLALDGTSRRAPASLVGSPIAGSVSAIQAQFVTDRPHMLVVVYASTTVEHSSVEGTDYIPVA